MEKCKVIAVTNQKGGVGKTTTTVNLGVGLAQQGKKVLLVDTDPQGSLTVSLGVKNPDELGTTISDLMQVVVDNGILAPRDNGILKDIEGVDLVPSNIGLSSFEVSLVNTMSREFVLRSYLGAVKRDYDYVLIDCMPSLGMLTINALAAADSVLIPCQANYLSTKGLKLLMGSVAKVRRQINPALKIDGILLTMVDSRTNNAKSIIAALPTHYYINAEDGLELPSIILLEQIRTIDKRRLAKYIGRLSKEHISGMNHALAVSIDLISPVPQRLTLCLCGACADAFRSTGAFALRKTTPGQAGKKVCAYCGQRKGHNYELQ